MTSPWTRWQRAFNAVPMLAAVLAIGACTNNTDTRDLTDNATTPVDAPNNSPPEATKDSVLAAENAEILLSVLDNDYDPDGDPLVILAVSTPDRGSAWLDDRGTVEPNDDLIRYQAEAAYNGFDSFTYTLSDGRGGRSEGLVVVTVGNTEVGNRRPEPAADAAATAPGVATRLAVLDNDTDPDGDALRIVALSPAANGSVRLDDGGTPAQASDDRIVYAPDLGFAGTDSFVYTVSDGRMSASAPVLVEVGSGLPDTSNLLSGHVIKGPVRGAVVSLYRIDTAGYRAEPLPVATAVTDENGFWSAAVAGPRADLLIVSAGGDFDDENDTDQSAARTIRLAAGDEFETVMPAGERYAVLTVYTNALLIKARADVQGDNFAAVFERSREQVTAALSFDPLATAPANPAAPDPATGRDALAYAQVIGAAANALNSMASRLGRALPNHAIITGLIRDLSDCKLDAQDRDGPISVTLAGASRSLPVVADLALSMIRFRNNRATAYTDIAPAQIDLASCTPPAILPDRVAPVFAFMPPPLNISSGGATTVPASHPDIAAALGAVTAVDDRDGPRPVLNNAPNRFPLGVTMIQFTAMDTAGNASSVTLSVTVAPSNLAPQLVAPIGFRSSIEGVPLSLDLAGNFTDPDGNPLSYALLGLPAGSGLVLDPTTGLLAGTPGEADVAAAPFTLTISASDGALSANDVFVLAVTAVNDAPVITAQSAPLVTLEDSALAVTLAALAVSDPDNAYPADFTLAVQPGANYSLAGNTLTPATDFSGALSVPVTVNDGTIDSAVFSLAVWVTAVNDAPFAADDTLLATTNLPQTHAVLANDSDIDGDVLTLAAVPATTAQGGSVAINDNATPADPSDDYIDYLSPPGFIGSDSYSYTISDGTDTAVATVTVAVSPNSYVSAIVPADGVTDVAVASNITIQFTEAMNAATMTGAYLLLSTSATGSPVLATGIGYDPISFLATIDPTTDLAAGTIYHVIVEATVENGGGVQQGLGVQTRFSTVGDADGDGLTAATEIALAATLHPCLSDANADSDGDELGDGLEVDTGSDPCFDDPAQLVYVVDDDGPSAAWPGAVTGLPAAPVPGIPGRPTMILLASGVYLDEIDLSGACDNIVYAGSLDPAQPGGRAQTDLDGRPTTLIDMGNVRNSELAGCSNAVLRYIEMSNGIGAPGVGGSRGGGLRASGGSTVLIDGVWMTGSTVGDQGGGLGVSNGLTVATVRNSVFADNRVTGGKGGGGIWVGNGATLDIADSRVLRNTADGLGGGGIFLDPGATGTITRVVVSGNRATTNDGGGIQIFGPGTIATVADSVISGNYSADKAGGVDFDRTNGGVLFKNNLVLANYAGNDGGGIHFYIAPDTQVSNCTVLFNQAFDTGGGAHAVSGAPFISDSIFFNNRAGQRTLAAAELAGDTFGSIAALNSDYNLVEIDADGFNDIDLTGLARNPDFTAGFYLNQGASLAIDSGSRSAVAAALDSYTTASDGSGDFGTVDRGFHQSAVSAGPVASVVLIEPAGPLAPFVVQPQDVSVQPLNSALEPLGDAQQVVFVLSSAPPGFAWAPFADVEPVGPGSAVAIAEGDGIYRVPADTSTTASGTLEFDVLVNGVNAGAVSVAIGP